jgi:hypothetical protein
MTRNFTDGIKLLNDYRDREELEGLAAFVMLRGV